MDNEAIDFEKWNSQLTKIHESYINASPFPYVVLDNFFKSSIAERIYSEFPTPDSTGWKHFSHINKKKDTFVGECSPFLSSVLESLNSDKALRLYESITGTKGLVYDEYLQPTLHRVSRSGYMNVHGDAITVRKNDQNFRREFTIYIFMTKDWKDSYNGNLELWDKNMKKCEAVIKPSFNKCVIFKNEPWAYHGLPKPLECPENIHRLAIGYAGFTPASNVEMSNGKYVYRPEDSLLKKSMIVFDREAVGMYKKIRHNLTGR